MKEMIIGALLIVAGLGILSTIICLSYFLSLPKDKEEGFCDCAICDEDIF